MAFYNGYPATYQPIYQYPVAQPAQQPSAQNSSQGGLIWVQGEAGAKSYLVAPNTTVQLWDSEAQVIYLKSADASGMPSMKTLDYTIRDAVQNVPAAAQTMNPETYATKADVDALKGQIDSLRMRLGKLIKKEEKDDE